VIARIVSPLKNDASDLFYRDHGRGVVIVHLHGGWGYEIYPAPSTIHARVVIPDRTGYGRSTTIDDLPPRFHEAAAIETEAFLDEIGLDRCVVWGHSDGAVIAAILALRAPHRVRGVVLEALHREREKPRSRQFFTDMAEDPMRFGPRVAAILERDHGARWQDVIRMGGRAWLRIAATPDEDFFDNKLSTLNVPALVVHGDDDPRTEPDELARIRSELPRARFEIIEGGGHCPHAHPRTGEHVGTLISDFANSL
jgi:pimeloyl-ACP methyl ester carboxylesterase